MMELEQMQMDCTKLSTSVSKVSQALALASTGGFLMSRSVVPNTSTNSAPRVFNPIVIASQSDVKPVGSHRVDTRSAIIETAPASNIVMTSNSTNNFSSGTRKRSRDDIESEARVKGAVGG